MLSNFFLDSDFLVIIIYIPNLGLIGYNTLDFTDIQNFRHEMFNGYSSLNWIEMKTM